MAKVKAMHAMFWKKYPTCCCLLPALLLLAGSMAAQPAAPLRLLMRPAEVPAFEHLSRDFQPRPQVLLPDTLLLLLPDTSAHEPALRRLLGQLRERGHLTASVDPAGAGGLPVLYLGPQFRWVSLRPMPAADRAWLEAAGIRLRDFSPKTLRPAALLALQQRVLEQYENNGYPFASVYLDSLSLDTEGGASAVLRVERNRFFTFNDLKINGDLKLPSSFLPQYLGLRAGQTYSRARVLQIREQLRSLLFVEQTANPTVTFAGETATVNLYLQKKRASRFDFVIGLLPQPNTAAASQRLLLTGSLSAAFQNALGLGERLAVEMERLRPETQKLDVQASLPYVLGSPFGADGHLRIFKRDSTWVDAQADLGVQYLLPGGNYAKFFWENNSSSLQKVDTLTVRLTRRLPPNLDLRQNGFGLEAAFSHLDYRFNPRSGWAATGKAVAGFSTVLRNSQIESLREGAFEYASLYDTVARRSSRYRLELKAEAYLPLLLRSTFKAALRGGGIFSKTPIYLNEQYRLGGNRLLRGFNEESLFATRWVMATAEYRLLLSQNSYLAAFADYAYIENLSAYTRSFLRPLGVGAGLTFETAAGIFGISLAIGRQDAGTGFDFRAAKFHLGYVNLF